MKKLTRKNLQAAKGAAVDGVVRFDPPKGKAKFLAWILYDNFFQAPKANIFYLIFLMLAVALDVAQGEIDKFPYALFAVLLIKARIVYYANKQYDSFQTARIFMAFDKEGVMQIASLLEGGRYVRLAGGKWQNVKAIRFYSDFMSIEVEDGSREGIGFFVMTNDPKQHQAALASLWYAALNPSKNQLVLDLYSEKEENEVSEYIARHFGAFDKVYHEVISLGVHIDVAMIPATPERNYITLCTIGAGAYRMNIPDDIRTKNFLTEYAEYVMYLPADWKIDDRSLQDESNYWPVRILKETAKMPMRTESWVGYGHTVSPADRELLVEGMPYSSVLLTCPLPEQDTLQYADLSSGKSVNFYQLHPLTPEELEYIFNNSTSDLLSCIYPEGRDAVEVLLERMS